MTKVDATNKIKHFLQVIELDSNFSLLTKTANFHFKFLGIVYFRVVYGNGQWDLVGFTTNMRSACAWN